MSVVVKNWRMLAIRIERRTGINSGGRGGNGVVVLRVLK